MYPSFSTRRVVGGGRHLPEIVGQIDPVVEKQQFPIDIRS